MKKLFITASVAVLLTACGDSKTETTTESAATETIPTEVESTPVKIDWKYYRKLANELKLNGITLSIDNQSSDSTVNTFYQGWKVGDAQTTGCNIIRINGSSIAMSSSVTDLQAYSLAKFTEKNMANWKGSSTPSNPTEYSKSAAQCYYLTLTNWKDMGTVKNAMYGQFVDVNADVVLDIYVEVYDVKSDMKKAEETMKKVIDYLAK